MLLTKQEIIDALSYCLDDKEEGYIRVQVKVRGEGKNIDIEIDTLKTNPSQKIEVTLAED